MVVVYILYAALIFFTIPEMLYAIGDKNLQFYFHKDDKIASTRHWS